MDGRHNAPLPCHSPWCVNRWASPIRRRAVVNCARNGNAGRSPYGFRPWLKTQAECRAATPLS
jgi:hypothetical protein